METELNKAKSQEDTAMEVNYDSPPQRSLRQLRLRDMGGIIVVDFIDLASGENRRQLFEHLREEMSSDQNQTQNPTSFEVWPHSNYSSAGSPRDEY